METHWGAAVATWEGEGRGGRREILEAESTGYGDETGVGPGRGGGPWGSYPVLRTTGGEGCIHVRVLSPEQVNSFISSTNSWH